MKNRGVIFIALLINLFFGGWSVDYILSWFSKDIPFIADIVLGLVVGSVSVPISLVGLILEVCNIIQFPLM